MELLSHIDSAIDPCDDFYRFSCGTFLKNTELDNRTTRSVQDVMAEEVNAQIRSILEEPIRQQDPAVPNLAKKFYRACMNESAIEAEGLKRAKQIFKQIGGWPTLEGNNWSENQFDWKKVQHKLRKIGVDVPVFITVAVREDDNYPGEHILEVSGVLCKTGKFGVLIYA